ncbi:MAG: hypothetical protein R6T92_01480, partial [Desulfosalsimonadaceae bacterium]
MSYPPLFPWRRYTRLYLFNLSQFFLITAFLIHFFGVDLLDLKDLIARIQDIAAPGQLEIRQQAIFPIIYNRTGRTTPSLGQFILPEIRFLFKLFHISNLLCFSSRGSQQVLQVLEAQKGYKWKMGVKAPLPLSLTPASCRSHSSRQLLHSFPLPTVTTILSRLPDSLRARNKYIFCLYV